ncbi:MAG: tripartite tricarboxylate transporter substrate binding protein [Burkholderiaceae bacterium]|nr:tripartite tricarboxylate transporter substrate binding protein [Burkholderiaceae bacterium]
MAATAALAAGPAAAQGADAWPQRPVRVVVPAPAGSSLDVIVRLLGERLKERWGQPLVVENKPGAGGMLGMDVVAKAAPDGYTLGIGFNGPIAFAPFMYRKMPYQPARDLLPVVLTTSQPNVLAVPASVPAQTLPEFVAWAKQQAGKVSYASVGNGSSSHLAMELFRQTAGFEAVHVPYNGSPPAAASLAAGETQALMAVAPALLPLVQAGKVKFLAVTSAQRVDSLKALPTVAESGFAGFEALAWNGLFAPAGTPDAVVRRLETDVNALLKDPAVIESFHRQGLIPGGGSAAQFKAYIEAESAKWGAIIRRAQISID